VSGGPPFRADLARSVRLFRAFGLEQTDPDHFYGMLARDTVAQLRQYTGIDGATILDIGGGVGAVPHALLEAGARAATDVDVSSSYVDAARAEAERRGVAPQIVFRQGDFVSLAAEIPEADVVTLDRVICCYPDVRALVSLSASHARRLYGLVFPRDTWWARLGMAIVNLVLFMMRNPMRVPSADASNWHT